MVAHWIIRWQWSVLGGAHVQEPSWFLNAPLGVMVVVFVLVRVVPGDPIAIMMGERALDAATHARLMHELGLDQPLWRQYATYLGQVLHGDLGPSFKYPNRTVNEIIADKLPVSLELGGLALLVDASPEPLPADILGQVKGLGTDPVSDIRTAVTALEKKLERVAPAGEFGDLGLEPGPAPLAFCERCGLFAHQTVSLGDHRLERLHANHLADHRGDHHLVRDVRHLPWSLNATAGISAHRKNSMKSGLKSKKPPLSRGLLV